MVNSPKEIKIGWCALDVTHPAEIIHCFELNQAPVLGINAVFLCRKCQSEAMNPPYWREGKNTLRFKAIALFYYYAALGFAYLACSVIALVLLTYTWLLLCYQRLSSALSRF